MIKQYLPETEFMQFWSDLIETDLATDKYIIKQKFITKLETIQKNDLKRLFILVADEYFTQTIGYSWFDFLLETHFYGTCSGGKTFFDNLNFFINTQNLEMIKLYILAIKLGFVGHKTNPIEEYSKLIQRFFPHEIKPSVIIPYKTINNKIFKYNLLFIISPLILLFIILNLYEFLAIKMISVKIQNSVSLITKELA